jgi:hypothetical protein
VYNVDLLGSVAVDNFARRDHCVVTGRKGLNIELDQTIVGIDPGGVVASIADVGRHLFRVFGGHLVDLPQGFGVFVIVPNLVCGWGFVIRVYDVIAQSAQVAPRVARSTRIDAVYRADLIFDDLAEHESLVPVGQSDVFHVLIVADYTAVVKCLVETLFRVESSTCVDTYIIPNYYLHV